MVPGPGTWPRGLRRSSIPLPVDSQGSHTAYECPPRSWGASLPLGAYHRSRRPESVSSRNSMLAIA